MTITTIATAPTSAMSRWTDEVRVRTCAAGTALGFVADERPSATPAVPIQGTGVGFAAAGDLSARVHTPVKTVNYMHADRKQGRPPRGVPR